MFESGGSCLTLLTSCSTDGVSCQGGFGVMWCDVVRCGEVWEAEAVPRAGGPGALPAAAIRRGRCLTVCSARSVVRLATWGVGGVAVCLRGAAAMVVRAAAAKWPCWPTSPHVGALMACSVNMVRRCTIVQPCGPLMQQRQAVLTGSQRCTCLVPWNAACLQQRGEGSAATAL